jgi:NhaC family Na+:H+ antiporter
MSNESGRINLFFSLVPVIVLVGLLSYTMVVLKWDDLPTVPIVLAVAVASIVALSHGYKWKELEEGMAKGIGLAMNAVLILMSIGILIGTWIQAGIVPTMIFYGLQIISPSIFLLATLIICSIVSLGTGSSWSTAGTVGVALIAIGKGLNIPVEMVAGAVISGAYFGDKMSPLSDTTNLAPAVAGTDLISHIKHMVWTTVPGYLIAAIIYTIMGLQFSGATVDNESLTAIMGALQNNFNLNPLLLLAPAIVIGMVVLRIPALPAIFIGGLMGGIAGMVFQGSSLSDVSYAAFDFSYIFSTTGVEAVDSLLNRGGINSMMPTVGLIIAALSFGGVMERTGMLNTIARSLLSRSKSDGSLIATTIFSAIGMNIIAAEQYMSIVIPGRMYKDEYARRGLHPKNLSRALEDSATLTSPLIPWNSCGAFMAATLGISPFLYLPYAFVNLANPIISLIYGYTGFTIEKLDKAPPEEEVID